MGSMIEAEDLYIQKNPQNPNIGIVQEKRQVHGIVIIQK